MAQEAPFYTYTNKEDFAVHVPNLGTLEPDEESRPTQLVLTNPKLKQKEISVEEVEKRMSPKETKAKEEEEPVAKKKDERVLRGIDRTSKKDNDEVDKK